MVKLHFVDPHGNETAVDVNEGVSVMQAAVDAYIPGMIGECGGNMACATCHVYVDDKNKAKLPPITQMEEALLDGALYRKETSRLACQIIVTDELEGQKFIMPVAQT